VNHFIKNAIRKLKGPDEHAALASRIRISLLFVVVAASGEANSKQ
jgi:hypothetical protein